MSEENTGNAPAEQPVVEQSESTEVENQEETLDAAPDVEEQAVEQAKEEKKQEEIKKALKSFELKVNGKAKKVDIDLDNEDQIKQYLSKALAADEKFEEAAKYRKQSESLVEMLQKNPLAILKNPALGLDIKKLAEQVLLEDLEEEQKSPEQKKLEEYERKLAAYEKEKTEKEEALKKAQLAEAQRKQEQEIEESLIKALESNDIPAEPYFMRRVADVWQSAVESGWEDATLEDIMPYVKKRMDVDFRSLIDKHKDPEKLEKLLGKDVLTNYRKANVSKVKTAPKTASQVATETAKGDEKKEQPKKYKISDIAGW